MSHENMYKAVGAAGCHFPDLDPDEKLLMVIRRHWLALFFPALFFVAFLFITLVLWTLAPFGLPVGALLIITIILWLFALQMTFIRWLNEELDLFLITDKRIIGYEQITFLNRKNTQASIDHIQEVNAQCDGLLPSLFHFGKIFIQTASETTELHMPMAPDAMETARIIQNIVNEHRHHLDDRAKGTPGSITPDGVS